MKERAEEKKYAQSDLDETIDGGEFRGKLEETERMKQFRARKQKELRRRKRNKKIRRFLLAVLILALAAGGCYCALKPCFPQIQEMVLDLMKGRSGNEEEETSTEAVTKEEPAEEPTTQEQTTQEPTTEEPTTEEPTTEAPDPRKDVWNHYQNMFVVVNIKNYLNVRDQPTQDGIIIGKLVKYAGGELLEDLGNGWYHISSGGIDGYVASEYCVTGEEARQIALEHCFSMVEVTAEKLNVRSGPGEEFGVWAQLSAAEKQVVKGEENGWLKIQVNNNYGYISKEFTQEGFYLVEAMPWSSISNYSPTRQALFAYAEQFIGTPYVYGGTNLWSGIDCSSYVQQCFRNAIGIELPRTSKLQANVGTQISLAEAKPGDLLFYADANGVIDHVVMYMGDGKILHAAQSLGQVIVSKYNYSTEPVKVMNVIGD
ncbi:MAG: C40 family peptidase [Lachnospiraceae bacterium]|nr:C40 family peptidase [Lachnospiraceae bacterium]